MVTEITEKKINVRGVYVNYLKIGEGEHPVLLLPGSLGSIWNDFKPQVENLDRTKFTIVAWDPPGYGKSIPPNRTFPEDYIQQDAAFAKDLMNALGYETFSMIGFCSGGVTTCVLAATYPDSVRKMIIIATKSYLTSEDVTFYQKLREIDSWPKEACNQMVDRYGRLYATRVWASLVDTMVDIYEKRGGDLCRNILGNIQCPTLIVQGSEDGLVDKSHAVFLRDKIQNSRLHIFEGRGHFLHLKIYKEFNDLTTEFLSST